jgi:CRISPR-associated protein Csm1
MENKRTILQLAALLYDLVPWYAASQGQSPSTGMAQLAMQAQAMLDGFEPVFARMAVDQSLLQALVLGKEDGAGLLAILKTARNLASDGEILQKDGLLRPILEVLGQNEKIGVAQAHAFRPKTLTIGDNVFPEKIGQVDGAAARQLWKGFANEFQQLPTTSLTYFVESLAYLMQKYTAFLPATSIKGNIVALCDHAKTVAALAACLYETRESQQEKPFLLVGGDLSGIQLFLYDIISKNASKLLKGRSFYLQLLIDSILDDLLERLKLTELQVVYASGGGFFFLAPNTQAVRAQLKTAAEQLSKKIFDVHQIQLTFSLAHCEFSTEEMKGQGISNVWESLIAAVNASKQRKFAKQMQQADFFDPRELGGEQGRDAITNEEFGANEKVEEYGHEGKEILIKTSTKDQIELGQKLRAAQWWLRTDEPLDSLKDFKVFRPCNIGPWNYFLSDADLRKVGGRMKGQRLFRINSTDFVAAETQGAASLGFVFYGGNSFPADEDGDPVPFDQLVGKDREGEFKRLAVLRMDVDNLGYLFAQGLKDVHLTFAHYACLSRNLDIFFKGYLNTLRESDEEIAEGSYIIYSGGDDLFIVGQWDLLFTMADRIQQGFTNWCCENPHIGLSGGITLVGPRFPISRAATLADEQEKKAKRFKTKLDADCKPTLEKNAIAIFGYALNWKVEFPLVRDLKDKIKSHLADENQIQQSFISKIKGHHGQYLQQKADNEAESWRWNLAWNFARMIEREGRDGEHAKEFLKRMASDIATNSHLGKPTGSPHPYLTLVNVAARWAELEIRQYEKSPKREPPAPTLKQP